jgi:positive regulator of sigma E activity
MSTANNLAFAGALLAVLLNTLTLVGVIWKAGRWSQKLEDKQAQQDVLLERITLQLDAMERRVGSLEGRR